MDMTGIIEIVGSLGFPIAAYILSMWMINKKDDAAREDLKEYNKTINDMVEKYGVLSEAINNNTEAVANNTIILSNLVSEINKEA